MTLTMNFVKEKLSMKNDILHLFPPKPSPAKFKIVGLLPHYKFQRCRYLVERLHSCYPNKFAQPEIRAMLNVAWDEYLTKMKRRYGKPYYLLQAPLVVYLDGELLGDDGALRDYVGKTYVFEPNIDFEQLAEEELIKYFSHISNEQKRMFAYITVAIDERVVGSMLFMLYNDLVPITCSNFLNRCTKSHDSFKGTKVHRIVKQSWVQCGGFFLSHVHMPCENYSVPHDRRGVLSMCNEKPHVENSTQFLITLDSTPWMDYKYVAFGQLIQGAEILNQVEEVPAYYENPLKKIEFIDCGEFTLCPTLDLKYTKAIHPSIKGSLVDDDEDDLDSVLSWRNYKKGKYCLRTDLKSYLPLSRYSRMFEVQQIGGYLEEESFPEVEEEVEEPPPITTSPAKNLLLDTKDVHDSKTFYSKNRRISA